MREPFSADPSAALDRLRLADRIEPSFAPKNQSLENPAVPLSAGATWLTDYMGGGPTAAGMIVTESTALRNSAVYGCVSLLAGLISTLPLQVYKRTAIGDPQPFPGSPMQTLLRDEPNPTMTSLTFRELLASSLLLSGNAYAAIERDRGGRARALWPIPSRQVQPKRVDGRLQYTIQLGQGGMETLDQDDMIHVPCLGFDGVRGLSPISYAMKQAVGMALGLEDFGANFISRGARPSGVVKLNKGVSPEAKAQLRTMIESLYGGSKNTGKPMLLDGNMEWESQQITPEEAQFLESRRFQIEEVARFYGVPPHLIGALDKTTSWGSGIEQQTIAFVKFGLSKWLVKFEQEFNRNLFTPGGNLWCQFNLDALLRGDSQARAAFYQSGIQNGWMKPNEARAKEDLPPETGGEQLFRNAALVPLDSPAAVPGNGVTQQDMTDAKEETAKTA